LPTQQVSEAPELHLPQIGARATVRPHLVSTERLSRVEPEAEVASMGMGLDAVLERLPGLICVLGQNVSLRQREDYPAQIVRSWSARAALKRIFDVVGAIVLTLIFSPLMLVIALLLRSEGGPIIYRHRRIGRDGKTFECLKFRTMVPDADRRLRELLEQHPELKTEWLQDHKLRNDPRITGIGRFLRRTSLDELPQIWNVLRGEMSLVGPRPVVRDELLRYGRSLPVYLSAKPGITGLWQVTGRNDTDYRRRVVLDVYYVRKQNLLLDFYILLKTTRVVLRGAGAY
jgi:exopolysaccharide production protein ExoY